MAPGKGPVAASHIPRTCSLVQKVAVTAAVHSNAGAASRVTGITGMVKFDKRQLCVTLQIRRPNNYVYDLAETLGPTQPNPTIDLSGLDMVRTVVQDSDNKLFIGGLPCEWPEDQVSVTAP